MKPTYPFHWHGFIALLSLTALLSILSTVHGEEIHESTFAEVTGKKLIVTGDLPYADEVRDHIREMEKQPFEGLIFRMRDGGGGLFDTTHWDKNRQKIMAQEKVMTAIKWDKFTDNFLSVNAATSYTAWNSDAYWQKVLSHLKFCARAARLSGCVGLAFDPEAYGTHNPWNYAEQEDAEKISYDQYCKLVYKRGQQFMRVLSHEFPDAKLLMFFQYSTMYEVAHQPDPALRQAALKNNDYWSLLLPFLNGMLSESTGKVQLIDGNESAYYYKSALDYYHAYWVIHQGAKINVPDALKEKYDEHVYAASALYTDYIYGRQPGAYQAASGMTDDERSKWFEHNVYYALKSSDEYVWLWNERMNWWKERNFPPGIVQALLSAKSKLMHGEKLGYDMESTFIAAQARLSQMLKERLIRRKTNIQKVEPQQALTVDGKLDEKVYQQIPWMEPFVTLISPKEKQQALVTTHAWMAYDQENLYIAFRCEEPDMTQQIVVDVPRDGAIWNGENVDFSILKPGQKVGSPAAKYYHFILNPANVQWDSLDSGKQTSTAFNADWKSATSRNDNGWTAEIALSWESIGITNVPKGMKLHGNLARFRSVDGKTEPSSWSQFIAGFQEPENFGTWVLR